MLHIIQYQAYLIRFVQLVDGEFFVAERDSTSKPEYFTLVVLQYRFVANSSTEDTTKKIIFCECFG